MSCYRSLLHDSSYMITITWCLLIDGSSNLDWEISLPWWLPVAGPVEIRPQTPSSRALVVDWCQCQRRLVGSQNARVSPTTCPAEAWDRETRGLVVGCELRRNCTWDARVQLVNYRLWKKRLKWVVQNIQFIISSF